MVIGRGSGSAIGNFTEKFLNGDFKQEVINVSLGVVVLAIAVSIVASLIFPTSKENEEEIAAESSE